MGYARHRAPDGRRPRRRALGPSSPRRETSPARALSGGPPAAPRRLPGGHALSRVSARDPARYKDPSCAWTPRLVVRAFSAILVATPGAFRGFRLRRIADESWPIRVSPFSVDGAAPFLAGSRQTSRLGPRRWKSPRRVAGAPLSSRSVGRTEVELVMQTSLCSLLGIDLPIIQGALGGPWPPSVRLAAAVTSAGALGTLPTALRSPDDVRQDIAALRDLTDGPFAVNHTMKPFGGCLGRRRT
jgi:hypothetical protein